MPEILQDYVINDETITDGDWSWYLRYWASGKKEAWGTINSSVTTSLVSDGNAFYHQDFTYNFPFTWNSIPLCLGHASETNYFGIFSIFNISSTGFSYRLFRATNLNSTPKCNFYFIGN